MRAIVFIGSATTGSSREAMDAAARLGYTVILLTNRKAFLQRIPQDALIKYMEYMDEVSVRKKIIQLLQIDYDIRAVISFIDPYVSMAARLSNEFCSTTISYEALKLMENKIKTRMALRHNEATCEFEIITSDKPQSSTINYPFILKNPNSNGSKDVYFIEDETEFEIAKKKITKQNSGKQILIEEFIDGPQYVIEVIVNESIPIIVAIIQQEITQDYTFIVTAYDAVLKMDESVYLSLWHAVTSIIQKIGLHHGSCHFEMRHTSNGWKLIELNPRISGGTMNRMIEEAFGINLVQETIKLYVGEEPDLIRKKHLAVHTSYITVNSTGYLLAIDGLDQAAACTGVVDVKVKPSIGRTMMPPLSMGHRYGYVMAVGESSDEARERAEDAIKLIKFYLEPL